MDINLRQAILHNIAENSTEQLQATIVDAIDDGQEKMLPGLGVLFELIWKQSDNNERLDMLQLLESGIKEAKNSSS